MEEQVVPKRFLTIFLPAKDIHLIKDIGMIPYILHRDFGFDCTLACYNNGPYGYLKKDVKGLKINFVSKRTGNDYLDTFLFLLSNGRQYDILQMYHFSAFSFVTLLFFKVINTGRKVQTYLKLDANDSMLSFNPAGLKKIVFDFCFNFIDVISVETRKLYEHLASRVKNITYLPNGFENAKFSLDESFKKKDEFIFVGRLSDEVKAVPIIIKGFQHYLRSNPESSWTLKLIGPYDIKFQESFENLVKEDLNLASKITLVGPIYDRDMLYDHYKSAKVFILASLSESFGLVYLEALQYDCYIVSTPLTPARDLTDNGKFGSFFERDNWEQLGSILTKVANDSFLENAVSGMRSFVYSNFRWTSIVSRLLTKLRC